MTTMNISLPEDMKAFIEDQAAKKGFATVSEYVRTIIRAIQEERAERKRLDHMLIDGLDSGPATPLNPEDWERIRREGGAHRRVSEPMSRVVVKLPRAKGLTTGSDSCESSTERGTSAGFSTPRANRS